MFEQTYKYYLKQISEINLESVAGKLGARYEDNTLKVRFFQSEYTISAQGIIDASGKKPSHDICVILSKYILLCPANRPERQSKIQLDSQLDSQPDSQEWVSYRNFKNSAPLHHYFNKEVEGAITALVANQLSFLDKASKLLGGSLSSLRISYDFAALFNALPKVPLILLYNTPDEEFPADCFILFQAQCEQYLDCESIAMLGRQLYISLKNI